MSMAYFNLYKRLITHKTYTEEIITEMVDDAHNKGRLTNDEYTQLVALIDQYYSDAEPNATEPVEQ